MVALVREDVASELSEYVLEGDLLEVLEEELAEAHALTEATASDSEQPSYLRGSLGRMSVTESINAPKNTPGTVPGRQPTAPDHRAGA